MSQLWTPCRKCCQYPQQHSRLAPKRSFAIARLRLARYSACASFEFEGFARVDTNSRKALHCNVSLHETGQNLYTSGSCRTTQCMWRQGTEVIKAFSLYPVPLLATLSGTCAVLESRGRFETSSANASQYVQRWHTSCILALLQLSALSCASKCCLLGDRARCSSRLSEQMRGSASYSGPNQRKFCNGAFCESRLAPGEQASGCWVPRRE